VQTFSNHRSQMLALLDELNPEQRLAVETTEGPVLILAGAGTGKTRAITFRMANLIANDVPAEAILAVTFTNKAAEEMRNRVSSLLLRAGVPPAQPWLSTFHSLCARLLRREAAAAGLPRDFAIYDDDDQVAAVKLSMSKLQIDAEDLTPRNVLSRKSFCTTARPWTSTTCFSAPRACCANPRQRGKSGKRAFTTFTSTNTRTPIACSMNSCGC
jgi:DNA helicase-2/ATP-dependent DNA helicase PcrA